MRLQVYNFLAFIYVQYAFS